MEIIFYIVTGITLVWVSAQKLEKYSVLASNKYGISPFLIGSTIIAFGTSAPELLVGDFSLGILAWDFSPCSICLGASVIKF